MSTTDPGSSAKTLAYRAAHRDVSCGPSSKTVNDDGGTDGPDDVGELVGLARSSHTSETIVISSPTVMNCSDRRRYLHRLPPPHVRVKGAC